MEGFAFSCAVVVAVVFVRAGVAKAVRPQETAVGFSALGVPAAPAVARAVPAAELALAAALLAAPRAGAVAALLLLVVFSAFLARAVAAGSTAPCNCFGQARAGPVSGLDVARNGLLALLAVAALATSRPVVPSVVDVVGVVALTAAGVVALRLARRRSPST
ncbi:MAG: MauE/DoxX family redox-associated membrane protein [Acidimicrobiales bacterium]